MNTGLGAPLMFRDRSLMKLRKKLFTVVLVPAGAITVIGPVVAPLGTIALIVELLVTKNVAGVPLNSTAVAPRKLDPVSTTFVPGSPLVGEKEMIPGRT